MSRPSKIAPARVAVIVDAIQGGEQVVGAARAAGISDRTLYRWLKRGDAVDRCRTCPCKSTGCVLPAELPYAELTERVVRARLDLVMAQAREAQLEAILHTVRARNERLAELLATPSSHPL